jgi:hypothetical protein
MKSMMYYEESQTSASFFEFCSIGNNCGQFAIVLPAADDLA